MNNTESSFTLIEILVVIAILAGMVVILLPNFMDARERARDAQRKSDIRQIQKALEFYKSNQSPPSYPIDASFPAPCTGWSGTGYLYMSKVPGDPSASCATPKKYYYHRNPTGTPGETLEYLLAACLDNSLDSEGGSCPSDFATITTYGCTSPKKCYVVTQP
ncbi:hypothetical protein A2334_05510 [Candidatus Roizmanbacteria bacterium RIFOXYB2_FULL_38_10]|uniref:Type II secretion system protein GspG C-terminal domain-containing protein n=1 Tax=Candidatus Roizmanbacteria bacterium RIFOXYD1_FULL_38_12 TaxID=1802093 RepID=A0A1F7L0J6_9BACT|nr:MAG: hypothetical protein A3K47_02630 [Candidatus Roizmanbacteria bacterium RIFOXYA2_FULL_38_14]OGK63664.1 MAG: hypothetical protein A3K27_02630 [Candidatus Roizmanbacteria bacterium RIFOXYA1_FULL_37_12]OGK65510.1 MAG: hypothetical protein A3K38_02630 [Candidatus Roizmanbacteria bacterium RIFOXYB1_FULL_40_23]OGK68294.1 MAG: hypothetical protein A2334_05510 [Candidatus Roizmanbacteria bacterium RIFOXYB2_FULL_38_10]OGK69915.1 MAG: hypothetical protein A3K21_02635 [Candidatus Roizmanbacteria ba